MTGEHVRFNLPTDVTVIRVRFNLPTDVTAVRVRVMLNLTGLNYFRHFPSSLPYFLS